MLKRLLPALVLGLCVALPAQAAVFAQQTDASVQLDFISSPGGANGWPGNTFVLPTMTGTLKAFDVYLSLSGFNITLNHFQGTPTSVGVVFGGTGCPTSNGTDQNGGLYLVSDLGIPANGSTGTAGADSNQVLPPVSAHFVLSGAGNIPTYTGQSGCTIQFFANGQPINWFAGTQVAAGTTDQLYFVGYDAFGVPPTLTAVSIASTNASTTLAKAGDTVTLTFTVDRDVETPQVTIAGHAASVATTTGDTFAASTTLTGADTEGAIAFSILTTNLVGDDGYTTSTTTDNTSVVLDRTAPVLAEGAAIGSTTNATPSYSFSSSEAGTITYGGSCSSATTAASAGTTTVAFAALSVGTYSDCTITVADAAGNSSTPLAVSTFEVDQAPTPAPAPQSSSLGDNGPVAGSLPAPAQPAPSLGAVSGGGAAGAGSVIPTPPPATTPAPTPEPAQQGSGPVVASVSHPNVASAQQPPSHVAQHAPSATTSSVVVAGSSTEVAAAAIAPDTTSWWWLVLGGIVGGIAALVLLFITSW